MIKFTNKGLIPIEAIRTMGLNAKDTDSPIGFFGTGLKYAIAVLLREKQPVTIFIGEKTYIFSTREINVRNKTFNLVTMNGEDLGFTTELGKKWHLWMAYRELWSNCLDENGTASKSPDDESHRPKEDETTICVVGEEFAKIYANHSDFFIDKNVVPEFSFKEVDVFSNESNWIFYKNIQAHTLTHPSIFKYNIKTNQELTEDRTLSQPWWVQYLITSAIIQSTDKKFIKTILLAETEFFESSFNFADNSTEPSNEFLETIRECFSSLRLNQTALSFYKKWSYRKQITNLTYEVGEQDVVGKALLLLKDLGYDVLQYNIRYFSSTGGALSFGEPGVVYLCKSVVKNADEATTARYILHAHFQNLNVFGKKDFEYYLIDEIIRVGTPT